ncbi:hypothetical protein SLA2020_076510 [Shorea laevis]
MLMNLQRIPKWWIWYYWICPVPWTVFGLIISQYGDVEQTIKVPGSTVQPSIRWYIESHFGYDPNFMGPVAGVLVGFTVFFCLHVRLLHKDTELPNEVDIIHAEKFFLNHVLQMKSDLVNTKTQWNAMVVLGLCVNLFEAITFIVVCKILKVVLGY